MSRIVFLVLLLLSGVGTLPILSSPVFAADNLSSCSIRTNPSPLYNTTRSAGFYINVSNTNNYDAYKMEFECSINRNKPNAKKENQTEIYAGVDNRLAYNPDGSSTGFSCEFDAGTHTIKVWAVTKNGEAPQCRATYTVIDAATACNLSVDPTTGITSATSLQLSGKDLNTINSVNEGFVIFFDDDAIDIGNNPISHGQLYIPRFANVSMPTFGPKAMPQDLMTPGHHIISLRQRKLDLSLLISYAFTPEKDYFSLPLCSIGFTVGTPDAPGSVDTAPPSGGGVITPPCTGDSCSKGGGKLIEGCNDPSKPGYDPKNPAIATAIGCIHTNPTELVKDFMKFGVGIGGGLAFLMMLLGAFQMLTSAGNPETLNAGKERLTSAVIGLLIVIFTVLLLKIIGVDILGLGGQFGYKP